jgi:hypothetical protein
MPDFAHPCKLHLGAVAAIALPRRFNHLARHAVRRVRLRSAPVLDSQTFDPQELARVRGYQRQPSAARMTGHQYVDARAEQRICRTGST